ncbi:MAG: hypothetical protein ACTHVY_13430 [Brevibacterium yomogidense]|uniref:hypothetical protein n=1 Tax=Brevibacterium sp. Mu109 TaxID=1255669 RepID=UPI000C5BBFB7|nr:hypothetical protein [Brevibacterium sp. Mu109]SMX77728.1 hypothetical protein BSP109_01393 [Brevibacterium sp. Mu109]
MPDSSRKAVTRTGLLAAALTTGALSAGLLLTPSSAFAAPADSGVAAAAADVTASGLSEEQVDNARTIIGTGKADDVSEEAITIALMTAMQESSLENLDGGDRDSAGLFQQRPSMGWGSQEDVTDPVHATQSFFGTNDEVTNPGLDDIAGWEDMGPGAAAQAVQRSAFPDAYDKWEPLADELLADNDDVDPID